MPPLLSARKKTAGTDEHWVHRSFQTKTVASPGAIATVGQELVELDSNRPLLLCSPSASRSPAYKQLLAALDAFRIAAVVDVPSHASAMAVHEIADRACEAEPDCLVAFGGGSVCDTAKVVAIALAEGQPVQAHAIRAEAGQFTYPALRRPKIPIVAIPMSAAGAEVTPVASMAATDAPGKLLFWDPKVVSRVVVIDPAANLHVPASVMLASGMNALAHCIEALYTKRRSPISSVLAREGVGLLLDALDAVALSPSSIQGRAQLMWAAHLSGLALASAGSGLHHAICHVLGTTFKLSHGDVNSVVLPHAVAFNEPWAHSQLERVGRDGAPIEATIRELQQRIQVPRRLRELGVDQGSLLALSEKVMQERGLKNNPRPVRDPSEIHSILMGAW